MFSPCHYHVAPSIARPLLPIERNSSLSDATTSLVDKDFSGTARYPRTKGAYTITWKKKFVLIPWCSNKTKTKMVLWVNIGLLDSITLYLCTLVGRLCYRHLCKTDLAVWVQNSWRPFLGYVPEISFLTRGWLSFHLCSPKDSTLILDWLWQLDDGNLMLKRRRISFDPSEDYFRLWHFLVLFPSLPLYLWNEKAFEPVGNTLGWFVSVNSNALVEPVKKVENVLVEIDIYEGLLKSIEINWIRHIIHQNLDYLGILFWFTY